MRVVVVGGGVAGLTAAHDLAGDHDVTVLEGSPQVGGKLCSAEVAGLTVDVGAEAMLARRPEGVALAEEVGLEVVHPTTATSRVWSRGALRPLPRSLMGVPFDVDEVASAGVLSADGVARLRAEQVGPVAEDVSVGDLVADRLGDEVTDRLVEPLLGGVYAGHARLLSARAAAPQLLALAQRGPLLPLAPPAGAGGPVFAGVPGGMARLVEALVDTGRFKVRTDAMVRELAWAGEEWILTVGPAREPEQVRADAVVVAVPPAPAARLLREVAPAAAAQLAGIETASVAVVTLAFRADDLDPVLGEMSGFLVPPVERRRIKASTFSFAKWDWVREAGAADGVLVLRASLGRHREEASLQAPDEELVGVSLAELAGLVGIRARPVDTHVQRWGGALPQYAVGHVDRVARIRVAVAEVPGLEVCGAAYDGVGIPAVIGSARRAVASVTGAQ